MTMVLALILCLALAADLTAQSLPGYPALVVVEDDSDPARPSRHATAYTYDAGRRVLTIVEEWTDINTEYSMAERSTTFTYDAQGRVASKTIDFGNDRVIGIRETTHFAYDAEGRLTSEFYGYQERWENGELPFWHVVSTSYSYDASGHLAQKLAMSDNMLDGTVDWIGRTVYTYESGQLVRELTGSHSPPSAEFVVESITTYDYDDQQRLVRQATIYTYPDGRPSHAQKTDIVYDEHGRPSRESWGIDEQLDGRPESFSHTTRTYDANGDLIAEAAVIDFWFGIDDRGYAFWYDSERRLIKKEYTLCCNNYQHAVTTYFYEPPSQ